MPISNASRGSVSMIILTEPRGYQRYNNNEYRRGAKSNPIKPYPATLNIISYTLPSRKHYVVTIQILIVNENNTAWRPTRERNLAQR